MANDANFVGNHLRLSAFLLCVEHGEMPARPSRFRRHPQILDGPAKFLAPIPPRVDCNVPVAEAYNEPLVITSKARMEARAIITDVDEEVTIEDGPSETNVSEKEGLSNDDMHVTSIYALPQSSVPHLHLTPTSANDQDSHNRLEGSQYSSDLKSILQSNRKATAITAIVKKTSGRIEGLSSTRKRRLPVHELALLRTTTLNGLPLPSDATVSFATSITVLDPIEDSQMRLVSVLNNRISRDLVGTKRQLSSRTTQPSNAVRSPDNRHSTSTVEFFEDTSPLSDDKSQYLTGCRDAYDGFVGSELQFTSTKRSSRRTKTHPIKRSKPINIRELALGVGSLPVPADYDMADPAGLALDKTTKLAGRFTLSRPEYNQPNARVEQLASMRVQNDLQVNAAVEGIPN
ncbi:hypothetical protein G6011_04727 [Alternaria panax]|uniref:Uncharacterized protein n=1 Tax=Alternaria panax TaxID=48097 RepID=A0AAD4NU63_9PLEO|nr:hypothetical protein G6011_04727 [Alternaria panax]